METRVVEDEILDSLEETDPRALWNRRDLLLLNRIMGNYRWLAQVLINSCRPGDRVLELGAGEGALITELNNHGDHFQFQVDALDRCSRPNIWTDDWKWHRGDLLTFEGFSGYNVLIGNLILHQFESSVLRAWFAPIESHLDFIVFSEPRRAQLHRFQFYLSFLLGMGDVSRHDGLVSIRAGFRGDELVEALGLDRSVWAISIDSTFFGSYRLVASRKERDSS